MHRVDDSLMEGERWMPCAESVSPEQAWALLRALAPDGERDVHAHDGRAFCLDDTGCLRTASTHEAWIAAEPESERGWVACASVSSSAAELFDLYMPLCVGDRARRLVLAHLGQSLDGRLNAAPDATCFITGREDVEHTHRLRALFDAVLIGTETAAVDNPRLTTRLVPGAQPVRVVLDPQARLDHELRVFSDDEAETIAVTATGRGARHRRLGRHVHVIEAPLADGWFALPAVLDALAAHGLRRVFIEGGGITVSRFLEAQLVDRLHLTVVTRNVGDGTPGVSLRPTTDLAGIPGVHSRRFALGRDVLFDCDLGRDAG